MCLHDPLHDISVATQKKSERRSPPPILNILPPRALPPTFFHSKPKIPRAELTDPLALKVDDGLGATQFPLILRIEWLTDAGRAEGKRLEDLTPGDPLPAYVGAYTLFFQLTARDNGTYDGKLLKTVRVWSG